MQSCNHSLQSVLILLATAVLVVVVFRSLRLPPMLGYLIVGVAIGPHALALDSRHARRRAQLAEIGVVFLMFSIGLEFSLPKLRHDAPHRVRPGRGAGDRSPC